MIGEADHEVVGEVFKLTNPGVIDSIAGRAEHVRATLLHDPDVFASTRFGRTLGRIADSGARSHLYGDIQTHKLHTKSFVMDAERGWLSTAAIMRHGESLDFSATFDGAAARAVRRLTLSRRAPGRSAGLRPQRRAKASFSMTVPPGSTT
jgi:hypothetical protein